jgi:hypothetical protein
LTLELLEIMKLQVLEHPKSRKMWGAEQPTVFRRKIVTMAFYKDLTSFGYQKILDSYDLSLKINLKSFNHNTKIVLRVLFE